MGNPLITRLTPRVYRLDSLSGHHTSFRSACSYLVVDGEHAIGIDAGASFTHLDSIGVSRLDAIYLTHHHTDHCTYLPTLPPGTPIHLPAADARLYEPERIEAALSKESIIGSGCPESYDPPRLRSDTMIFDVVPNADHFWRGHRIRFVSTPGHGANAVTILVDIDDRCYAFCGDVTIGNGRLYEPYHLETDHWTGAGALAAWEGVERLGALRIDTLCPTHGRVVSRGVRTELRRLSKRLLRFYRAKGQIARGEADLNIGIGAGGYISEHLYRFGTNGYCIVSDCGEGFVVDPTVPDLEELAELVDRLGITITGCTSTHYHCDHIDGVPALRERGARFIVHSQVCFPIWPPERYELIRAPWLPEHPITPDVVVEDRRIEWNEYILDFFHSPGQTWWHASVMVEIDGAKILFSGDTFQPSSRWNGTGGFCAYNRSRFESGFARTCRNIISRRPDIIAAGHGTIYRFTRSRFRKIIRWSRKAKSAVRALCPSRRLEADYYVWPE